MKLWIINGPNMNLLGIREPEIYGKTSYSDLCGEIRVYCENQGIECLIFQSNCEGAIVDKIQQAYFEGVDGLVLNPAAYTHTSLAIADALRAVRIPCAEVHISDPEARGGIRTTDLIRELCIVYVSGKGTPGYLEAIEKLCMILAERNKK